VKQQREAKELQSVPAISQEADIWHSDYQFVSGQYSYENLAISHGDVPILSIIYPLVNKHNYRKIHHFQWVNPL